MKISHALTLIATIACSTGTLAIDGTVVERGAHYQVWELPPVKNQPVGVRKRVIEVQTGMNRWNEAARTWEPAPERIDMVPGGAVARFGQYDVTFSDNLNAPDPVKIRLPDGGSLNAGVLALAYRHVDDYIVFANIQDCVGEVAGAEITYRNVFREVAADIKYTLTKASFEQFVVIREQLPSPELFGLPRNSVLEVVTAFDGAPPRAIKSEILRRETRRDATSAGIPSLVDEHLDFGSMLMPDGTAFAVGANPQDGARVAKNWVRLRGRKALVEQVDYEKFEEASRALPRARDRAALKRTPTRSREDSLASLSMPGSNPLSGKLNRLAALSEREKPGFVVDYQLISSGSANYTFQGDTTYYISGTVTFSGTTVFEGGTVIKFASGAPYFNVYGPIVCKTSQYRPAIFASSDDSRFGDPVTFGTLSGYYAGTALAINGSYAGSVDLHDMRFLNAGMAVDLYSASFHTLTNIQVVDCGVAIRSSSTRFSLRNGLISNATNAFLGDSFGSTGQVEHVTFDRLRNLSVSSFPQLLLTNCIVANVTNVPYAYAGASNAVVSGSSIFESVGSGSYYLPASSPLRDIGTTNINQGLRNMLSRRTTYAPVVATNSLIATNTLWSITADRDTDVPDLGYHYDPLDYFVSGLTVSNATLVATNGCAVGVDFSTGSWGMLLKNSSFVTEGSPTLPNPVVRAHMAQERGSGNPGTRAMFYDGASATISNALRFRFSYLGQLPNDGYLLYTGQKYRAIEFTHSACYDLSVVIDTSGSNPLTCGVTNTLFERGSGQFGISSSSTNAIVHFRNNLCKGAGYHFVGAKSNWTAHDNLTDAGGLYDHGVPVTNSYNAYFSAASSLSGGTSNITLTNLTYNTGPLGEYYQPTNSVLINRGSTNANLVALYHFTTTTNQVRETNSIVDCGIHYVALDASGNPLDEDSDLLPSYWEDRNGNGSADAGELSWLLSDTDGDGTPDGLELLQGRNPMGGALPDTGNTLRLQVYTPLR